MAIARTGVYVDDYLEYASTLPAELQRLLNTIRELDERSHSMVNQTRQQTKYCLGLATQGPKKGNGSNGNEEEEVMEKTRKDIEANQDNALNLCTEKVLLARQAYELIDSHIKRLDEDLHNFAEDLKQEGKIAPDEPAILPPLPIIPKSEKRKFTVYGTPQSKRLDFRDRDWDRERDRDFELMPPPGSHKKDFTEQSPPKGASSSYNTDGKRQADELLKAQKPEKKETGDQKGQDKTSPQLPQVGSTSKKSDDREMLKADRSVEQTSKDFTKGTAAGSEKGLKGKKHKSGDKNLKERKAVKEMAMENNKEERQAMVNMGVAILVLVAFGAYVSYTIASKAKEN